MQHGLHRLGRRRRDLNRVPLLSQPKDRVVNLQPSPASPVRIKTLFMCDSLVA